MENGDSCEFKPMGFLNWLRCGVCWYTKAGALLVLGGGFLLWFRPEASFQGVASGDFLLKGGAVLLVLSLVRDLWILARRKK